MTDDELRAWAEVHAWHHAHGELARAVLRLLADLEAARELVTRVTG